MQLVIVGGGTGTNALAPVFDASAYKVTYVVPISDNGGSTSEVLRLFGGPAIGDARSRLVRLIDPSPLRNLLALRLSENSCLAAHDWNSIVEGSHVIWTDISPHMKAMYRAFLVHVHAELLKRTTTTRAFDFSQCSVGNLLLTGARLFFGTLDAAIEFVLHTTRVPERYAVLPCINSNSSHHIAAKLQNNAIVVGQSAISHPAESSNCLNNPSQASSTGSSSANLPHVEDEDLNFTFVHPSLRQTQISFAKTETKPLPSAIDTVYYVNLYGDEIRPVASPRVLTNLETADAVVCSVGSLYTSIIPILLLQGFADNIPDQFILMINGCEDRETAGMRAINYLDAINASLTYSRGGNFEPSESLVTAIIHPENCDVSEISQTRNVHCEPAECIDGAYQLESLTAALKRCLHSCGSGVISIDKM